MDWMVLLYLAGAALMIWLIVRMVRANPGSFTREAIGKSIFTLGILAILLIAVVVFCVLMLR